MGDLIPLHLPCPAQHSLERRRQANHQTAFSAAPVPIHLRAGKTNPSLYPGRPIEVQQGRSLVFPGEPWHLFHDAELLRHEFKGHQPEAQYRLHH